MLFFFFIPKMCIGRKMAEKREADITSPSSCGQECSGAGADFKDYFVCR